MSLKIQQINLQSNFFFQRELLCCVDIINKYLHKLQKNESTHEDSKNPNYQYFDKNF